MLKQRVATALLLAAGFLCLLFLGPWQLFAAGVGVVICAAAWEWTTLAGIERLSFKLVYLCVTVMLGAVGAWLLVWSGDEGLIRWALLMACGWWAIALLWVQGYPSSALLWGKPAIRAVLGWLVLIPAWCALLYLRAQPAGAVLILLVVLLVACADIGAYFTGRAFGRHKLAPAVSPGKTWEGVVGGMATALLVATVLNTLWGDAPWGTVMALVIPTALVSVLGDLFESMVKRHRGVKDSGHMLPGHGGVLDRVDGLTAALPVFALVILLSGWQL